MRNHVEEAQGRAEAIGLPARYFVADANTVCLDNNTYDIIVNVGAMHHVAYINRLTEMLAQAAGEHGLYVGFDYVGPHRNQYSWNIWSSLLAVNERLPAQYRRVLRYAHVPTMLSIDPSEAIHSELQISTLLRHFTVLDYVRLGGGVAYELLYDNKRLHADQHTPTGRVTLELIMRADTDALTTDPDFNLFSFFVAKPKRLDPVEVASQLAWRAEENEREARAVADGGRYYPPTPLETIYNQFYELEQKLNEKPGVPDTPERKTWNKTWDMELDPAHNKTLWYRNKLLCRTEFDDGIDIVQSRPAWISFDTGSVCNLRCVQCPRENPVGGFTEQKTEQKIVDRVFGFLPYLERLSLYGLGEPLLSDVFWSIIEHKNTAEIPNIDVNSNGTLLSDENVDRLLHSNLNALRISIDGATAETYRRIRGGSFDKVISGVRRLTERRQQLGRYDFKIWIAMTLMLENIRELPLMVDLAVELGVDALWAQHLVKKSDNSQDAWRITSRGWTFVYNDQHLSNAPSLSNDMVRQAQERAVQRHFKFELDPELWFPEASSADALAANACSSEASVSMGSRHRPICDCHQPWESLFVGPSGNVQPCCFTSVQIGNLNEQSIDDVWNGSTMARLRRSIRDGHIDPVCRNAGCKYVQDTEEAFGLDSYDFRCHLDTEINLCEAGRTDHCYSGWYAPEYWGIWSKGKEAILLLDCAQIPIADLQLDILCRGAGYEDYCSAVRVEVNGHEVDCWQFYYPDSTEQSTWRTLDIPAELMQSNRIQVRFLIDAPVLPKLWGCDDGRLLGIGVSKVKVRRLPNSPSEQV
jgi:radical SAM protein with 4Fe4S-binding SPASM domain